jgi:hypothetical protein
MLQPSTKWHRGRLALVASLAPVRCGLVEYSRTMNVLMDEVHVRSLRGIATSAFRSSAPEISKPLCIN